MDSEDVEIGSANEGEEEEQEEENEEEKVTDAIDVAITLCDLH